MALGGLLDNEAVSERALEGRGTANNGQGLVDLWVFKRALRSYLIDELMAKKNIPPAYKAAIREVTQDFTPFRNKVGFKDVATMPYMTWKCGWTRAADLMLALLEDRAELLSSQHQ